MSDSVLYGLIGLVFFQAYVTVRVVRHKSYTSEKKRNQLLIIWLVPFVGAALALAGLSTDKESPVRPEKDGVPQKPNKRD
jgi:hypothetical protein